MPADWPERAPVAERFEQAARQLRAAPVSERPHWALRMLELALRPVERAKAQAALEQRSA